MPENLIFPSDTSFEKLCDFSLKVDQCEKTDSVKFRTGHVGFFSPTSMIFLAKTCRTRARKHDDEEVCYYGLKSHDYANNLGFSDALNLEGKPFPQGAFGGKNYLPISGMRLSNLEDLALDQGVEVGDAIQLECNEIAKVVSQRKSKELQIIVATPLGRFFGMYLSMLRLIAQSTVFSTGRNGREWKSVLLTVVSVLRVHLRAIQDLEKWAHVRRSLQA